MRLSSEKAMKYLRSGHIVWQVWGHAHQNRFVTPHEERLEVYVRSQVLKGKRRHQEHGRQWGQFGHLLNGALGGIYFTKKKEAERFAQEIRDGHHMAIVWDMREDADTFDLLDEELGICDRGMGIYDEHLNYQYDELEFA
jgi:hypothetical protein